MTDAAALSTMSPVKLTVRPGETVQFPGRCVACDEPAVEWLRVQKRQGQITRVVEAPLCAECARQSQRRSGREEQLLRLRWLAAGLTAVLLFAAIWLLAGGLTIVWWRLAAALAGTAAGVTLIWWVFGRMIAAAALPEKRAVTDAVRIAGFSSRVMTLVFARDEYADAVTSLNPSNRIESQSPEPAATI